MHEQELGCRVVTLTPLTLDLVWHSIVDVGEALGRADQARDLVTALRDRVEALRRTTHGRRESRVLTLEWFDPPFIGGHWVPEQVEAAGGVNAMGASGEKSRQTNWDEIVGCDPDVIVLLPCGYDLERGGGAVGGPAREGRVAISLRAVRNGAVWAVDANGWFSRPGPRLVDGIEALSQILADPIADSEQAGARRLGMTAS